MKTYFKEEEHPRDEDGKFTEKDLKSKSVDELKQSQQIELKKEIIKENITPQIFAAISTIREELEASGKARTTVYTFNYKYKVEIFNDDSFSYRILRRTRLK